MRIATVGFPLMTRAAPFVLMLLAMPVLGSDNTEGLDECLASARGLHDGLPIRWEVENGTGHGFEIEVVGHRRPSLEIPVPARSRESQYRRARHRYPGLRDDERACQGRRAGRP